MTPSDIIRGCSALVLLLFLTYIIYLFGFREFPDFYTPEDKAQEYANLLYHLPLLLPALLGWSVARRGTSPRWLTILYVVYGILALILYSNPIWSGDALQTGLSFLLFGLPYGIILSIVAIVYLLRNRKLSTL